MTIQKWLSNVKYDKFGGTYIWNIDENGGSDMVATVRGWGALQHEFKTQEEAGKFQDEVGEFIAQAIREKIKRDFKQQEQ
jgi:hypothetical protein